MPLKPMLIIVALICLSGTSFAQVCQVGKIARTTQSDQFLDNGDGTITDAKTGLMWMRCSLGQVQESGGCGNGATSLTWSSALQAAEGFNSAGGLGGYADWRLPNIKELGSIVEYQCHSPAIDLAHFPDMPAGTYWSSTPDPRADWPARSIHFVDGSDLTPTVSSHRYVRLVRRTSH